MLEKHLFLSKFSGGSTPDTYKGPTLPLNRWKMLQKHSILLKFSWGSTPDLHQGSASRLLENASKALIFVKIFRGLWNEE